MIKSGNRNHVRSALQALYGPQKRKSPPRGSLRAHFHRSRGRARAGRTGSHRADDHTERRNSPGQQAMRSSVAGGDRENA
jgi:hypothetical protein